MEASQAVTVRPYEPRDREAVREICRSTGMKGDPTFRFFEDAEVLVAIYADYYLEHEAENCFVAEVDGKVVVVYLEKRNYRLAAVKRFTLWDRPTGKKWCARLLVRDADRIPEVETNSG
jgi:hypothetical protein